MRHNKPHIPPSFKADSREVGSSVFAYDDTKTLVSYAPKKDKTVLLLSSHAVLHRNNKIDPDTGKPEIVVFYNQTKSGVDTYDQLCHAYSTARRTRHWPMRMFFGILDQSAVNANILYGLREGNKKMQRGDFLEELAFALLKPFLQKRLSNRKIRRSIRQTITFILELPVLVTPRRTPAVRDRCYICDRAKDHKTNMVCTECDRPICDEHRIMICLQCEK